MSCQLDLERDPPTFGPDAKTSARQLSVVAGVSVCLADRGPGNAVRLGERPEQRANRLSRSPQFAAVDEELTGRENVEMIARLCRLPTGEARRRTAELLERFELVEAADRRVSTYSGGMRRRLDLAAGLIGRPPVVLLDEPTTGLDPRSRQELWRIIDELRRDGTTVLLTTQYLEEADRLAQRIGVVDRGRIAAHGTAAELKAAVGATIRALRRRRCGGSTPGSSRSHPSSCISRRSTTCS